jgi:hypothetical protein
MSSRSHSIFQVNIEADKLNNSGFLKRAKLNLCDLAGSEKLDKTISHKGIHFNEMININLSLVTLGKVINSLRIGEKHIPYR